MRTLISSTAILVSLSGTAMGCPTISEGVQTHSVSGEYLYTPRIYSVMAGGDQSLSSCGMGRTGYVISQPDFSFYTSGMAAYERLELEVSSPGCDTVLLVNAANAEWFFDDDSRGNLEPVVNLYGPGSNEGRVDVWVGTYNGEYCSATLELETW